MTEVAVLLVTSYPALVGAVLAALRDGRGMTQAAVAAALGVAGSTWSRVEAGTTALAVDQLARVAAILDVAPASVLKAADRGRDAAAEQQIRVEDERVAPGQLPGYVVVPITTLRELVK